MKKTDVTEEKAKRADQMDSAVNSILRALRKGEPTRLPGLGTITPGKRWTFRAEPHGR